MNRSVRKTTMVSALASHGTVGPLTAVHLALRSALCLVRRIAVNEASCSNIRWKKKISSNDLYVKGDVAM